MKYNKDGFSQPFLDVLNGALIVVTFLFVLALLLINPVAKHADIVKKAEYLITLEWDVEDDVDLDLWVSDPNDHIVYYSNKDVPGLNLERDDLGNRADNVTKSGQIIHNPVNKEVITLRQVLPGAYHINVQYYQSNVNPSGFSSVYIPVEFEVVVIRLNPKYKEVLTYKGKLNTYREVALIKTIEFNEEGILINKKDKPINLINVLNKRNGEGP